MSEDGDKFLLKMKIEQAKRKIKCATESLKDNEHFIEFVEGFGLMVEVDGKKVPVDRNTICFYDDNQTLIKAEIETLKAQLSDYEAELQLMEQRGTENEK